ncbi:MAG: Stealth CR1 domain-containing protein [Prevotella pallens]|jgi:receptor polysaccharide phosphotransferase wefF|uniref:stealth family protein n=1 Tax=Prevotella pallens TaxID=60133 RepID=UPI001CAE3FC9|nr:stealth family protein [Prevotella pallens]MBF1490981.1 Stealth CR1 domain-containing protein [Prevotella pallens]
MNIDFVIFWVDGSDIEWQKKKAFYKGTPFQNIDARYRDWDILKYWFRAVEKYAPWVNHVYFVADNQRPEWLAWDNSKLSYVDHKDFIPHEYLPTFQANTIENNLHRIAGLSEYFVVFNDDMFINAPIEPEYYFKNALPCDAPMEHLFTGPCYGKEDKWGISIMEFCDIHLVNAHFNRMHTVRDNFKAWYGSYLGFKYLLQSWIILLFNRIDFQHFYTQHNEKAFLKSVYKEVWEKEPEILSESCTKFRESVSVNNYLFRYWQLASNKFYPTKLRGKAMIPISECNMEKIHHNLFDPNIKSLCLNDSIFCTDDYYETAKMLLKKWFKEKFPFKSQFEK